MSTTLRARTGPIGGQVSSESLLRVGVLISGSGRTLRNFIELSRRGELPATICTVISSSSRAGGLEFARQAQIPWHVVDPRATPGGGFDQRITELLTEHRVELVCMAGFLHLWRIPPGFAGRVMNIHPALLPAYGGHGMYGDRVHRAVLDAGDRQSGCTVHFADNVYDHGPIILQREVPVNAGDTPESLAARVFEQELIAYPEAIRLFAAGRLTIQNQIVRVR